MATEPKEIKKKTVSKKPAVKAVAKVAKAEVVPRLRIRVRAYESKILDTSVKQIIDTALRYDVEVLGPIPLPTEIKKYTVNRASFVYKNAREQFEMRVHKRLIDILNPNPKIIEASDEPFSSVRRQYRCKDGVNKKPPARAVFCAIDIYQYICNIQDSSFKN